MNVVVEECKEHFMNVILSFKSVYFLIQRLIFPYKLVRFSVIHKFYVPVLFMILDKFSKNMFPIIWHSPIWQQHTL